LTIPRIKKTKATTQNKTRTQSIEAVPEEIQVMDLLYTNFLSCILSELMDVMSEELKKNTRTMSHQMQNIDKEIKTITRYKNKW
jgi:hypothetical protein